MNSWKGRRIFIIAGPNGAGETTFAKEFLPNEADCPIFVNADLIAAGLAPFDPDRAAIKAGRLMLEEIFEHVRRRDSFAFETTLSGRIYARHISVWREQGFMVKLFIENADTGRRGGHEMSSKKLDSTKVEKKRDPDFVNSEIALMRAARKARQLAQQAGIGVIVLQDGQIMEERPDHV